MWVWVWVCRMGGWGCHKRRQASIATVRHAWVEERMGEELNERV